MNITVRKISAINYAYYYHIWPYDCKLFVKWSDGDELDKIAQTPEARPSGVCLLDTLRNLHNYDGLFCRGCALRVPYGIVAF